MYPARLVGYRQPRTQPLPSADQSPLALPQPLMRLTAMASIGVGAGLVTASAPTEVLILTFAPAVIAIAVIAAKAISDVPEPAQVAERPTEVSHG